MSSQHKGKETGSILIMKAVYNPHLYIWYFNFGDPGLLNNTKMLDRSSIIGAILTQKFDTKVAKYSLNGWLYGYL